MASQRTPSIASATPKRRPRGEPRRLLLEAAKELFARQDYRSTTTREIAETAGVAEHLLFRNFGSKAALFREAVVVPFTDVVDDFAAFWESHVPESMGEENIARQFLGRLYDFFVDNRGLVITLWSADALSHEELDEAGIAEIGRAVAVLGRIGAEGDALRGLKPKQHDLVARSTLATVAGMAAFGATSFGGKKPSRDAIIEELTQATLHGFLHRDG